MNEVTIGVIVPIYNVEKYLRECLEALVNQREPFDEIILVNDGSTDLSKSICEEFICKYNNMSLINQDNQGLSMARNAGMRVAKSDYIIFVDSDDYLTIDTVSSLKNALVKQNVDIMYYSASIFNEMNISVPSNQYCRKKSLCGYRMSGLQFFTKSFADNYIVSACLAAYKVSFLCEIDARFPQGLYFEDIYFYLITTCKALKVYCLSDKYYIRRYREDSIMTGKWGKKKCKDIINIYSMCWKYVLNTFKEKEMQEMFREYFAFGMICIIERLTPADNSVLSVELADALKLFFSLGWERLNTYQICEIGALLVALHQLENYSDLCHLYYSNTVEYRKYYNNVKTVFINKMKKWLEMLPFNKKNITIGIYGIGQHTQNMLKYYQKYVGEIKADIFYIVSDKYHHNVFNGKKIVTCDDLDHKEAVFIVSSKKFQDEMKENLVKSGVEENRIIRMYADTDFGDLVMIDKIFESLI